MFIFAIAMLYDVVRSTIAIFNKDFRDVIQSTWSDESIKRMSRGAAGAPVSLSGRLPARRGRKGKA
jgi:hypothetical protein